MNKSVTEQASSVPVASAQKVGFFERKLIEQLEKANRGSLTLISNGRNYAFGDPPNVGVSASVEVNDLSFFRKACLGGLWEWPTVMRMETGIHRTWFRYFGFFFKIKRSWTEWKSAGLPC